MEEDHLCVLACVKNSLQIEHKGNLKDCDVVIQHFVLEGDSISIFGYSIKKCSFVSFEINKVDYEDRTQQNKVKVTSY